MAAMVLCLSTIGLVNAAASPQAGREASPGQAAVGIGRGTAAPAFASPEVMADRRVTFRIFAAKADEVRLAAPTSRRIARGW